MKKSLSFVCALAFLGIISTTNWGCKSLLPDKKLQLIKDSLSKKAEYYDPEFTDQQIMVKCWLDFKSETLVDYTSATYSTNNILAGFYEAGRTVVNGKYSIKKDKDVYYAEMEFQEKTIQFNAMQINGLSYQMVNRTISIPTKLIVTVDSNNNILLENWKRVIKDDSASKD